MLKLAMTQVGAFRNYYIAFIKSCDATPLTATCTNRNMRRMARHKYLDPAYSLIMAFAGPDGKLASGIDAVASIVGRDRTNVYRWMIAADRGGTDGIIPSPAQRRLREYATRNARAPRVLKDFFGGARAA